MNGWYNTSDPKVVGHYELNNKEFMFWLYCPIKTPNTGFIYPDNLLKFSNLVEYCLKDEDITGKYIYLTVKSLYVDENSFGQREGWHSDGFLTDDVNFIWSDENPTTFSYKSVKLTSCHNESLKQMNEECSNDLEGCSYQGVKNMVYRLTSNQIHKPTKPNKGCFRNFVKVSVSDTLYKHAGMSSNHKIGLINENTKLDLLNRKCPKEK